MTSNRRPDRSERHHFIPRLLLKGFASRIDKDKVWVWQFRRGAVPREISTKDVGVARHFHGRTGEIEAKLSTRESIYAPLIERLRAGQSEPGDRDGIADFVSMLIVRTKNVRDGMTDAGNAFLASFDEALHDENNLASLNQRLVDEVLQKPEIQLLLERLPKDQQEGLVRFLLSRAGIPNPAALLRALFRHAKNQLNVPQAVIDAQLRALDQDNALDKRREELARLTWSIVARPDSPFILGDVGPVVRVVDQPILQSPLRPGMLTAIYLPISHQAVLVGHQGPTTPEVNHQALNLASAELSRGLFVASQSSEEENRHADRIGTRATLFDQTEINEALRQLFQ